MTNKQTHLTFIQNTILRLSNYSFQLRGLFLLILGGVGTLELKEIVSINFWVPVLLTLMFTFLDAFYLSKEKEFRKLYEKTRIKKDEDVDFSMTTESNPCAVIHTIFSQTILVFYGGLLIIQIIFFQNL